MKLARQEERHLRHGWANSSFQQPVHGRGKRVWCQHTPFNCEPGTQIGMNEHR